MALLYCNNVFRSDSSRHLCNQLCFLKGTVMEPYVKVLQVSQYLELEYRYIRSMLDNTGDIWYINFHA
jgi:hypothetical protein